MTDRTAIAPPHPIAARREEIETPEHVALGYDLADLGSRFVALAIDLLIIVGSFVLATIGIIYTIRYLGTSDLFTGWGLAVLALLGFTLIWGYFFYFEGFRDGQTPGKRLLRIRAVHDGGYPLTIQGAAIRNLIRVIDFQPAISMIAGGLTMMLHPRTKRLGDLAAGTIVVRERLAPRLPEEELDLVGTRSTTHPALRPLPPRLTANELATLTEYLARRDSLPATTRDRIAAALVERLAPRLAAEAPNAEPDDDVARMHPPAPADSAATATSAATTTTDALRLPAAYANLAPADLLARIHTEELERQRAAGSVHATGSALAAALTRHQRPIWDEYRALLERAQKRGLARLSEDEVSRFATLYREVSADLARARSYGASDLLLYSLERWVGAGHNLLYRPAQRSWRAFRDWIAEGFPALVRRRWQPIALATFLFILPTAITWVAVEQEPDRAFSLLSAGMIARAEEAPMREAEDGKYVDIPEVFMPVMASQIITNNIQVTFFAFAGGILAGLGTVLIMVINGVNLGAVAALFANQGASMQLWSFVLPHGVIELTAIFIAGGAGLWLGSGIIMPGRRTRRDALIRRGREAVSLIAGVAILLVVAGIIEGFISPAPIPRAIKLLVALVFALLLALYLLTAGRAAQPD